RSKTGPWSWFRLLDEYATLRSSDSYNEIMVTFSAPGLNTTHILRSLSSANPFDSRMLSELIVPETL
ncbi:MAG: type VI secretion IcmF C-terminal domain-containing protein, partial [Gammaproteobacteria bacterium]